MDNIEHTNNIDVNTSLSKQLMYIAFASIISADNDQLDEETKQSIIAKYEAETKDEPSVLDWDKILDPVKDDELRNKYIELLVRKFYHFLHFLEEPFLSWLFFFHFV